MASSLSSQFDTSNSDRRSGVDVDKVVVDIDGLIRRISTGGGLIGCLNTSEVVYGYNNGRKRARERVSEGRNDEIGRLMMMMLLLL